MILPKRV